MTARTSNLNGIGNVPIQLVPYLAPRPPLLNDSFFSKEVRELLAHPVEYFVNKRINTGKAPLTNIAFALDESGSMARDKMATIEGFNAQVEAVQTGAVLAGETTFTSLVFNEKVRVSAVGASLRTLKPLTLSTYNPGGGTALYDAIGTAIEELLKTPDIWEPQTATLVTVFTDGEDQSSRNYSVGVIHALISRLEATGRWTFALVGPMHSVSSLATNLAIKSDNVAGFDVTSALSKTEVFGKVASANSTYFSLRSAGITAGVSLYGDSAAK